LLDEPLSNLDAKLRTTMRAELIKLHARLGTTFVYVTHDQTEAMTMATKIVVMRGGFLQQVAPPQELYEHPCNLFVATFIGTPQMNVTEATLIDEGGGLWLSITDEAKIRLPWVISEKPELEKFVGNKILFGIRPNSVIINPEYCREHPDMTISCTVDFKELLGADLNVFLKLGDITFTAVTDSMTPIGVGDTCQIAFDAGAIHLFDPETEITVVSKANAGKFAER
jgi:multiple sugar transport system ATP-binding protein